MTSSMFRIVSTCMLYSGFLLFVLIFFMAYLNGGSILVTFNDYGEGWYEWLALWFMMTVTFLSAWSSIGEQLDAHVYRKSINRRTIKEER